MDDNKHQSWNEWLESLTAHEASAFLLSVKKLRFSKQQRIFQQGDCDSRLIFVQSGKLKLCYWDRLKKKSVKFAELSKGDVYGGDVFFSHSPQTGSVAALEDTVVLCLDKKDFKALVARYPAIEHKLMEYCTKYGKKIVFTESEKFARRVYPRYPVSLNGQVIVADGGTDRAEKKFSVIVSDISMGGARCQIKDLGAQDAEKIYQRQIRIKIFYQRNYLTCDIEKLAKVVAIRFPSPGETSLHVEFQIPLTEKELFKIVQDKNIYTYS